MKVGEMAERSLSLQRMRKPGHVAKEFRLFRRKFVKSKQITWELRDSSVRIRRR